MWTYEVSVWHPNRFIADSMSPSDGSIERERNPLLTQNVGISAADVHHTAKPPIERPSAIVL